MSYVHNDPLQGLVLFTTGLRIWSGGVKLSREDDLSNVQSSLPPTAMVSDGRKALVKPSALAPFHAIRKRLERLLHRRGFRLTADTIAIPETESEDTLREIDALETEFNDLIPGFLAALPRHYEEQIEQFPEWSQVLSHGRPDEKKIALRLKFEVGVYKINAPDPGNPTSKLNRQYRHVINSAVPALLNDIAAKANELLKGPIGTRHCVTQAQHASVRKLVDRLNAFSFLDHRVGPTADALLSMIAGVPHTGSLNPGQSAVLKIVVESLADPETVLEEYITAPEDEITPNAPTPSTAPVAPVASPAAYVGI